MPMPKPKPKPKRRKRFPDSIPKRKTQKVKLINDNSTSAPVPALPASRASASTMSSGARKTGIVRNIDQNVNSAISSSASDGGQNRKRNNCTTATRIEDSTSIYQLGECQSSNCIIRRKDDIICMQARRILQLEEQVKQLSEQLQELQNSTEGTDRDPAPSNTQISKTRIVVNANTNVNSRNFADLDSATPTLTRSSSSTSIQLEQCQPVMPVITTATEAQRSHTTPLSSLIHTLSGITGMAETDTEMTDDDFATASCSGTSNDPSCCHSGSSGSADYVTAESASLGDDTYCAPDDTYLFPVCQPRSVRLRPASLSSSSSESNTQSAANSQDPRDSNRNSTAMCEDCSSNSNPSEVGPNKRKGDSNTASISKRKKGPKQKP